MLTWLANLLSGGRLDRTERKVEELERERDYAWGEFRAESERTEWQAGQHAHWRELHHRAVQQRDQAGKDLARANARQQHWVEVAYGWKGEGDILIQKANELNRSRRGWRWLYEAKCGEWAEAVKENLQWRVAVKMIEDGYSLMKAEAQLAITQERGLRDGWEQTAGELQAQVEALDASLIIEMFDRGGLVAVNETLQAQVRQGDNNLQRVEAERDEALAGLNSRVVGLETKNDTIERLEAQVRHYQAQLTDVGLERDPETGRFRSAD